MIRLDCSNGINSLTIEGQKYNYTIRYCYVSQRGYYPSAMNKANQDSYLICESLLDDKSCHLFGIFDGHGESGDYCSHFAADQLPTFLMRELHHQGNPAPIPDVKLVDGYSKSFVNTNAAMHNNGVDDVLSGTTGITVMVRGDKLFVANVGDSRAIIASEINNVLKYTALSSDQTPYRKDERERVKSQGGRIMTLDQIEGNEPIHENWGTNLGDELDEVGDPPRVWDSTLERPGCAFTRSLGDHIAKSCGVCAVPEVLIWDISPKDKFAVIASDGVFEFITSQTVVEMIAKFKDPIQAAKYVVAEAYRLWLTFDERTDDITIIIIYFDDVSADAQKLNSPAVIRSASFKVTDGAAFQANGSPRSNKVTPDNSGLSATVDSEQLRGTHSSMHGGQLMESRPVRKVMSKARRKEISESFVADEHAEPFDFDAVVDTKSPEDIQRINQMLRHNFMFENLSALQREQIFKVMTVKAVRANEVIIEEGALGDEMYIVDSGEFSVLKKDEDGISQIVFVYTAEGSAFGELSLMYGKPRAASVIAKTDGRIWSIGRLAFKAVIMKGRNEGLLKVMQTVPALSNLGYCELHRLCVESSEVVYSKGECILGNSSAPTDRCQWILGIILSGTVRMQPLEGATEGSPQRSPRRGSAVINIKGTGASQVVSTDTGASTGVHQHKKRQLRTSSSYVVSTEIGLTFGQAWADENKTKIVFISKKSFLETVGAVVEKQVLEEATAAKMKGKRINYKQPDFESADRITMSKLTSFDRFSLQYPMALVGDFGYVGTFASNGVLHSVKVVSKEKACSLRSADKVLLERNVLAANASANKEKSHLLPLPECTFQNDKIACLIFKDVFTCDLSLALQNQCIGEKFRPYIMACLYSALSSLHSLGVEHRYINTSSVYITNGGIPKIADFRFCKAMDGCRNYTICGDPLFFAPEIVSQKGYDYAADLWALGVLFFEIYEGIPPFGTAEMEETALFKAITSYKGVLAFSDKTSPAARDLISSLVVPAAGERCGYKKKGDVLGKSIFKGVEWDNLHLKAGPVVDIQPSLDSNLLFSEKDVKAVVSALFDQY